MSDKVGRKIQSFSNKELTDRTIPQKYGFTDAEIDHQCFKRLQLYVELGEIPQFDTIETFNPHKL